MVYETKAMTSCLRGMILLSLMSEVESENVAQRVAEIMASFLFRDKDSIDWFSLLSNV